MASNLDDSVRSERDSIVYDDVASQTDRSKDSITAPEDVQEKIDTGPIVKENEGAKTSGENASELTKDSQKKGLIEPSSAVDKSKNAHKGEDNAASSEQISKLNTDKSDQDKESHKDKRKIRKESDKELWTPMKSDHSESKDSRNSDNAKKGDVTVEDSSDAHPTKPPRRHPQKKLERAESGELDHKQKTSPSQSSGSDPVKPPRRRLPQAPKSAVTSGPKPDLSEKNSSEGGSTASDDGLSVTSDGSEQKPTEIVCKPVLTSSPNQDEIPSLSVETVDKMDTSRRVLSFLDDSSESGVRKVESFYDYLYSQDDINPVTEVTSPVLKEGDRIGSALSDSDDHLYDSVPVEDSVAESFSWRSGFESYDEVIVNQGMDVYPVSRKSNQHQTSPYNINTSSREKVMSQINKMITKGKLL